MKIKFAEGMIVNSKRTSLEIAFIGSVKSANDAQLFQEFLQSSMDSTHVISANLFTNEPHNEPRKVRLKKLDGLIIDLDEYKGDISFIREIKEANPRIVLIALSEAFKPAAKSDKLAVELFQSGIDDGFYIKRTEESYENSCSILAERFNSIIKRYQNHSDAGFSRSKALNKLISIDGIDIDPEKHTVKFERRALKLNDSEFKALYLLARRPDIFRDRNSIMAAAYDDDIHVNHRTIDSLIKKIRSKAKQAQFPELIKTLYGGGYSFMSSKTRSEYTQKMHRTSKLSK